MHLQEAYKILTSFHKDAIFYSKKDNAYLLYLKVYNIGKGECAFIPTIIFCRLGSNIPYKTVQNFENEMERGKLKTEWEKVK